MNLAILVGRLAHTPELKSLPSGSKVMEASLATNRSYKNDQGELIEATDWHNLKAFGKTAETMAKWLKGGDQVVIHGSIRTHNWEDKDTQKKMYRTEIIVERFEFGAKNLKRTDREEGNQQDGEDYPDFEKDEKTKKKSRPVKEKGEVEYPEEDINPEDIPF